MKTCTLEGCDASHEGKCALKNTGFNCTAKTDADLMTEDEYLESKKSKIKLCITCREGLSCGFIKAIKCIFRGRKFWQAKAKKVTTDD